MKNLLLKRNEVEHDLTMNVTIRSPVIGHVPERNSI